MNRPAIKKMRELVDERLEEYHSVTKRAVKQRLRNEVIETLYDTGYCFAAENEDGWYEIYEKTNPIVDEKVKKCFENGKQKCFQNRKPGADDEPGIEPLMPVTREHHIQRADYFVKEGRMEMFYARHAHGKGAILLAIEHSNLAFTKGNNPFAALCHGYLAFSAMHYSDFAHAGYLLDLASGLTSSASHVGAEIHMLWCMLYRKMGNPDLSVQHAEQAISHGYDNKNWIAVSMAYQQKAHIIFDSGNVTEARLMYKSLQEQLEAKLTNAKFRSSDPREYRVLKLKKVIQSNFIGRCALAQGTYNEAIRAFELTAREIEINHELSSVANASVAKDGEGKALSKEGKFQKALAKFDEALKIRQEAFGSEGHPFIIWTRCNIVDALEAQGRSKRESANKERLFDQALNELKKIHGTSNIGKMGALAPNPYCHNLCGRLLRQTGKARIAVYHHEQALEGYRSKTGNESHVCVAQTKYYMGKAHAELGNRNEAWQWFVASLNAYLVNPQAKLSAIERVQREIRALRVNNADSSFEEALEIFKIDHNKNESHLTSLYKQCVVVDAMEAAGSFERETANQLDAQGGTSTFQNALATLENINRMFNVDHMNPNIEKAALELALNHHEKALQIYKGLFGDNHVLVTQTRSNIGKVYAKIQSERSIASFL